MIHYRISPLNDNQLTDKIYRSFQSVCKENKQIKGSIYAYSCYHDARTEQTENRLNLRIDITGFVYTRHKLINESMIIQFIDNMKSSKRVNPKRCNADKRNYFRGLYDGLKLFGFDQMGRAFNARIYFDISCSYNRTTSPIFINNQRSNKKGLLKYID